MRQTDVFNHLLLLGTEDFFLAMSEFGMVNLLGVIVLCARLSCFILVLILYILTVLVRTYV